MDHYNEQMVRKQTEAKEIFLRALIVASALLLVTVSLFAAALFGFTPLILVAVGVIYLAYILFSGTFLEYEYIVTNNDLDIDRISGKRKRKRLITVKLNTVNEWGEYTGKEGSGVSATVMASDASGYDAWYIIADHSKYGKIMVIFTPTEETVSNINFGVPHSVKKKLKPKAPKEAEETDEPKAPEEETE
ncbi:MAG: hypothetical protein J1F60_05730 [Oscillospiraceae bacterium]|nr:hypothetical protein [Oscillospiraceae bacterium]